MIAARRHELPDLARAALPSHKLIRRAGERALDYGITMNTRGGPGLVLAAAAYSAGLVGVTSFISLMTASIATAIFTEPSLKRAA